MGGLVEVEHLSIGINNQDTVWRLIEYSPVEQLSRTDIISGFFPGRIHEIKRLSR